MQQIVSITSQGQLTIPVNLRRAFQIKNGAKALIRRQGQVIIVEPKNDFWSLSGALKSKISLSDKELRQARQEFGKKWPRIKQK